MNHKQNEQPNRSIIEGVWYPKGNSKRYVAVLQLDRTTQQFEMVATPSSSAHGEGEEVRGGEWDSITISSRVGNTPRKLNLADGSLFESTANDQIDELLTSTSHRNKHGSTASRLESSWPLALGSVVILVAFSIVIYLYGIPAGARYVAHKLPVPVHEKVSEGTLPAFDNLLFEGSTLSSAEQEQQHQSFQRLLDGLPDNEHSFKLHIRSMRNIPNAFALPSGDVVITDALVKLAENQQEIEAVMLHEIGHVVHRHGVQQVLQGSAVGLIATLALGDLSGIGQLMAGLPVFLVQSSYSRKAELEADDYAFEHMQAMGLDTVHFANIITRLGALRIGNDKPTTEPTTSDDDASEEFPPYFSSHPTNTDRADRARRLSTSAE